MLPVRPFLYTLDQIAGLLNMDQKALMKQYIYFTGRSLGVDRADYITARNIALPEDTPDWRVLEKELLRWMKRKGFQYYEAGRYTR